MSIKIGFIDDTSRTNLKTFQDVIVPLTIEDDSFSSFQRSGGGALQGVKQSNKANITVQFDRLTQANLGILRQVMHDRNFLHKTYIHHPADAFQEIDYGSISNPSTTHIAKRITGTDTADPTFASATEYTTGLYNDVSDFSTNVTATTGALKFAFHFFQFDIDLNSAGGAGYLGSKTINEIQRLTLFMDDPRSSDGSGDLGFKIDAFNDTASTWIEIYRQSITTSTANRQFASIRPMEGFTNFADFVSSSGKVTFRMRNLQERVSGTLSVGVKYVELMINGFGVVWTNPDNFTFRDSFTGAGFTGTMELEEL